MTSIDPKDKEALDTIIPDEQVDGRREFIIIYTNSYLFRRYRILAYDLKQARKTVKIILKNQPYNHPSGKRMKYVPNKRIHKFTSISPKW